MADRLTDEGLAHFGEVGAGHVGDAAVPGLVALVACGEQVHVEVRGRLCAGGPPVRRDSLFRIASTTKPITAAAALALVEEGALALDEPVGGLLPELADPACCGTWTGRSTTRCPRRARSPCGTC